MRMCSSVDLMSPDSPSEQEQTWKSCFSEISQSSYIRYLFYMLSILTMFISSIITIVMHHSLDITGYPTTLSIIVCFTIISDILGIFIVAFDKCYQNTFIKIGYAITQVVVIPISIYAIYYFPLYIISEVFHVMSAIVSCMIARQNVFDHHNDNDNDDDTQTLY